MSNNKYQQIHNNDINQFFQKQSFGRIQNGSYKIGKDGATMNANQETRWLFSSISRGEIKDQSMTNGAVKAHVRQLMKDRQWMLVSTEKIEVDLDKDVNPGKVAEEVERLTLLMADGDKEKLEALKEAYDKVMAKIKEQLPLDQKYIHSDIDDKVAETFEKLGGMDDLEIIETDALIPREFDENAMEALYTAVLKKPFEQMAPEITITITRKSKLDYEEPTYLCSESVCDRIMDMSREILDQDLASLDEIRAAFTNGYNDGIESNRLYRLQEATYHEVMDGFNRLEKEYT